MEIKTDAIQFGKIGKVTVEDDIYNEGTDQEYFPVHFNYTTDNESLVLTFGKTLQSLCNEKGYKVFVDTEGLQEIKTIQIEIHNTEYESIAQINEALHFIANYAEGIQ